MGARFVNDGLGCVVMMVMGVLTASVSTMADEHVLLAERELLAIETAGPDVLVLVYRDGDRGEPPTQDRSAYRVNGQAVQAVGRHSAPIYQERVVDWRAQRYPMIIMHRIYLVLDERLQEGERYRIEHPDGRATVTFDSRTIRNASLKVNQAGYSARGESPRAFHAAWLGDLGGRPLEGVDRFEVVAAETGEVVLAGDVVPAASDAEAGDPSYVLELAGLEAGSYYIVMPGVGRSPTFGYGDRHAFQTFYVHMKGFYHQRCGIALTEPHTRWTREACHTTMRIADAEPHGFIGEPGGEAVASIGGHHDAGDFDHRVSHTLVGGWLLNAFELSPEKFTDGQLNLPESGNGIPDLLDEALFAIKRWEVLQADDGGVRAGKEADKHPTYGQVNAASDDLVYRTYRRYGHTTLAGAALFAYASRMVASYDGERAAELHERAVRAWRFFERHEDDDAYNFAPGVRLFASNQLYLLTGESAYHDRFIEQARSLFIDGEGEWPAQYRATYFNIPTVDGGMVFTHYFASYLLDDSREKDAEVVEALKRAIIERADSALRTLASRDWAYFSTDGWGMSTGVGRWGDFLVHAHHLTGEQRYLDAASRAADFVLGANPAGWSFTTGLGERPPYTPLQLDAYMHIQNGLGPTPGLVIYGVADVGRAPHIRVAIDQVYPSIYDGALPKLRAISDGWSIVPQNEFTTWETMAPNAFLHAYLAPEGDWQGAQMPYGEPRLPGGYPVHGGR